MTMSRGIVSYPVAADGLGALASGGGGDPAGKTSQAAKAHNSKGT